MISNLLYAFGGGWRYVQRHPHILLSLLLLIGVPMVFLYTGQQFLEAGRANQDSLYRERVGFLHEALAVTIDLTKASTTQMAVQTESFLSGNEDIAAVAVFAFLDNEFDLVYGSTNDIQGRLDEIEPLLRSAAVQDNTLIFPILIGKERIWQAARIVRNSSGQDHFIYTEHDLSGVDDLLRSREHNAYFSLLFIYTVMLLIAYWQIRSTDYRYLYNETKRANEMKDLFSNMITHELRAPLTAIRGYASMIEESKKVTGQEKEQVSRIRLSAERLLLIVNDLLDVARIQSGKLSIESIAVNATDTVLAVRDELESLAKEKNITLVCENFDTEYLVVADAKRLHQALTNLVSNAIKYTEQGSITVSAKEKPKTIEIRIKDTGMGIAAEDQKKLFAPFFRVQSENVSEITGTGLGMWITEQLITLMGGQVAVESIKGVGTHVVVNLPKVAK